MKITLRFAISFLVVSALAVIASSADKRPSKATPAAKVMTEKTGGKFSPGVLDKTETHMFCQCGRDKVYCLVGYSDGCESCCRRYNDSKKPVD